MTLQMIVVDDSAPGATTDAGIISDGATITNSLKLDNTGDFSVNTDKFTVASSTGNTAIDGTLDVSGNVALGTDVLGGKVVTIHTRVAQPAEFDHTSLSGTVEADIELRVFSLSTGAAGDITLTLEDGAAGQEYTVYLINDGGDDIVVTPANFWDGTTYTLDTAGQYVNLIFLGTNWHVNGGTGTLT